jgi:hypothetical protein
MRINSAALPKSGWPTCLISTQFHLGTTLFLDTSLPLAVSTCMRA